MANAQSNSLDGSATLFIIIVLTIITIYLTVTSKTTNYFTDFVTEQEQFLRNNSQYYALQHYAISLIKDNFEKLVTDIAWQKKPIQLAFEWPPETKQGHYAAHITVNAPEDSKLTFDLKYAPNKLFKRRLNATIEKKEQDNGKPVFVITQWQPNA